MLNQAKWAGAVFFKALLAKSLNPLAAHRSSQLAGPALHVTFDAADGILVSLFHQRAKSLSDVSSRHMETATQQGPDIFE